MPNYVFSQVGKSSITTELFYHMNDAPSVGSVITDEKGMKWKRIFTNPQASFDTQVDPHSASDFVRATNKKGVVGDLWERAGEMSAKRADKEGGRDPIKERFYKNYSKKHAGIQHPQQKREESVKKLANVGIKIDWGND